MILFSPIGTADPITALGDGPMLHIVRHYRPIVVVLFLSAEIAAFENADRRYSAAITRLAPETDVRIVTYTNPSVHRFDLFVPVFRNHLVELSAEFPDRTILLNTSSGTPAMQAALSGHKCVWHSQDHRCASKHACPGIEQAWRS